MTTVPPEYKCPCMICTNIPPDDEFDKKMLSGIKTMGWHSVGIIRVEGDDDFLPYTFTQGFWHTWKQPDLIVSGCSSEAANQLIDHVSRYIADGHDIRPGRARGILPHPYQCWFVEFPLSDYDEHLGTARHFYRGIFPVLQLVWPDENNLLPWDIGYHDSLQDVYGEKADSSGLRWLKKVRKRTDSPVEASVGDIIPWLSEEIPETWELHVP